MKYQLTSCTNNVIWSPSLCSSDPEVESWYQDPAHTPAPADLIAYTAVNHVTPQFYSIT